MKSIIFKLIKKQSTKFYRDFKVNIISLYSVAD